MTVLSAVFERHGGFLTMMGSPCANQTPTTIAARIHATSSLLPPITPTPSGQGELLLVRREPVSDHLDVQHARANLRHVKDEEQHHRQEVWDRAIQAGRVAQQSGQQIAQEQKTKKPGAPQP